MSREENIEGVRSDACSMRDRSYYEREEMRCDALPNEREEVRSDAFQMRERKVTENWKTSMIEVDHQGFPHVI